MRISNDELSPPIQRKWLLFFEEMEQLNDVSLERCLSSVTAAESPTLCVFADTSLDTFGACAYLRSRNTSGGFEVKFIAAKSRVGPLKELTIPRLELQTTVSASRLCKTIHEESRMQFKETVLFKPETH